MLSVQSFLALIESWAVDASQQNLALIVSNVNSHLGTAFQDANELLSSNNSQAFSMFMKALKQLRSRTNPGETDELILEEP